MSQSFKPKHKILFSLWRASIAKLKTFEQFTACSRRFKKKRSIYLVSGLECQWFSQPLLGESGVVFALETGAQLRMGRERSGPLLLEGPSCDMSHFWRGVWNHQEVRAEFGAPCPEGEQSRHRCCSC